MPRPRIAALAVSLAVGLALAACHRSYDVPVPTGDVAASLAHAKQLDGSAFDPKTLAGKPTLVLFVSPTCPHCLKTIPRAAAAAKAKGDPVVAVFVVGSAANASDVVRRLAFPGIALIDDGTLRKQYAIRAVPYIVLLGVDGTAKSAYLGEQSQSELEGALDDARGRVHHHVSN